MDNYFYGNTYALQYKSATDEIALGSSWSKYDGNHYGQIIWADVPIPHQYKWYNKNADKIDYNVYAKYNRSLHQNWNAFVDMQYKWTDYVIDGFRKNPDIYIHTKYSFFNPKIGIFYADKNGWSGYASFSKASKEPNRDDFETGLIQRPKPEHLYDYELSVEKKCTKASFSTVLYYMYYRDQLVLNGKLNDVGENTRMNVPQSYRLGLEFQATTKPIDWFEATAHVTWSKNKIKNFTAFVDDYDSGTQKTTYYKNTNISFSPNVIAGFTICFIPVKYFKIDLMNKYVSRQFLDNTSNKAKSLNAYDVQDVRLNYTIATKYCKALSIVAQINNIFNTQYESNGWTYSFMSGGKEMINNNYFPMAGTNIMVALHIDW